MAREIENHQKLKFSQKQNPTFTRLPLGGLHIFINVVVNGAVCLGQPASPVLHSPHMRLFTRTVVNEPKHICSKITACDTPKCENRRFTFLQTTKSINDYLNVGNY